MTSWRSFVVRLAFVAIPLLVLGAPRDAGAVGFLFNAFGADAGGEPRVKVYRGAGDETAGFLAFDPGFRGGVRVALGDIDGDGIDDVVVGAGPGGGPLVRVFRGICPGIYTPPAALVPSGFPSCSLPFTVDATAPIVELFPFPSGFRGGVFVAVGNFDKSNDAGNCLRNEIVVGTDAGGGPEVRVFRNATVGGGCAVGTPVVIDPNAPIVDFFAFPLGFTGGVRVAAADLNNDGFAELIVGAGPGGGPQVEVFKNLSTDPGSFGGLDTVSPVVSVFPFPAGFTGGVYVAAADFDGGGRRDLVVGAGPGGGPQVIIFRNTSVGTGFGFDLASPLANFFAFESTFTGGVRVAAYSITSGRLFVMPGPPGPGIARSITNVGGVPTDTLYGGVPFGLAPLGGFPAQ